MPVSLWNFSLLCIYALSYTVQFAGLYFGFGAKEFYACIIS